MQQYFAEIVEATNARKEAGEEILFYLSAEESDFCRFNGGKIRQAGQVEQRFLTLTLIQQQKMLKTHISLSGTFADDMETIARHLKKLRSLLATTPDDPFLNYERAGRSSVSMHSNTLPEAAAACGDVVRLAKGEDLVGVFASGGIYRGFANSLGQFNWYENFNFNLDFSLVEQADKAVKSSYSGFHWDAEQLEKKLASMREQKDILRRPAAAIKPGTYRAYLAPGAMEEVFGLLNWQSFGARAQKTRKAPIEKLVRGEVSLSPRVSVTENTAQGIAPNFDGFGFRKPEKIPLIEKGKHVGALVSARSGREYDLKPTGASEGESLEALHMDGGSLSLDKVAERLGEGLYINNLWYLNYSDRAACRMTGMTRFATFWVEGGRIKAPLPVMRFDDSLYRMLGTSLEDLTPAELIVSSETYGQRSTSSQSLPGALLSQFALTL